LRLGRGLGGKSFLIMTGDVAAVQAAIDAARKSPLVSGMVSDCVCIPAPHQDLIASLM